jgi:hypothetical protein
MSQERRLIVAAISYNSNAECTRILNENIWQRKAGAEERLTMMNSMTLSSTIKHYSSSIASKHNQFTTGMWQIHHSLVAHLMEDKMVWLETR